MLPWLGSLYLTDGTSLVLVTDNSEAIPRKFSYNWHSIYNGKFSRSADPNMSSIWPFNSLVIGFLVRT